MTLKNAIAKAEKITGLPISKNDCNQHWFNLNGYTISFFPNGRISETVEATGFYTQKEGQNRTENDMNSDYWPGTFHDNLTQAINFVSKK